MKNRRHLPTRWLLLILTIALILVGIFAFWSISGAITSNKPVTYDRRSGHIVVQLASSPGPIAIPIRAIPEWTLYGNGTVIFEQGNNNSLWQAQLSLSEVQNILNVVVNQDAFFSSTHSYYGEIPPGQGEHR